MVQWSPTKSTYGWSMAPCCPRTSLPMSISNPELGLQKAFFLAFRGISWHKTAPGTPRSNCRWPKVKVTFFLMVSSWCYTSSVTWISAGFAPWNWEVLFSMSLGTQFIHGLWKWVMLYHLSIIPIIDGENFWYFLKIHWICWKIPSIIPIKWRFSGVFWLKNPRSILIWVL